MVSSQGEVGGELVRFQYVEVKEGEIIRVKIEHQEQPTCYVLEESNGVQSVIWIPGTNPSTLTNVLGDAAASVQVVLSFEGGEKSSDIQGNEGGLKVIADSIGSPGGFPLFIGEMSALAARAQAQANAEYPMCTFPISPELVNLPPLASNSSELEKAIWKEAMYNYLTDGLFNESTATLLGMKKVKTKEGSTCSTDWCYEPGI